jgi:transcriptional regulator with XRE-family HTH domain
MSNGPLGSFLRAQRERLHPADVGLPARTRRRTPGLRREDVAERAGVSVDYYARLEQGRGRNPTPSVLDALARALVLNDSERLYLHRLAHRSAEPVPAERAISERTRVLLDTLQHVPAYVVDTRMDVLAWNPLADALLELERRPAADRNLIWLLFCDHGATIIDVEDRLRIGVGLVAQLRARSTDDPDDPRLQALVERVSAASPEFRAAWNDHIVDDGGRGAKRVHHPIIGELQVDFERLALPESGQYLVVYLAPPGSPARRAFDLLAVVGRDALRGSQAAPRLAEP